MTDRIACAPRLTAAIALPLLVAAGPIMAQSPSDLVQVCALAVQTGVPPSFVDADPYVSDGTPGDPNVIRAWNNIASVTYFEFLSLENIYDDVDRIAHECRFQLRDGDADLPSVLVEMAAVLEAIGPIRPLEIDETFPHAAFACRSDGLPLTVTVKRNSDETLWITVWDTTWNEPGC
jgi:hypothetical protein